MQRRGKGTAHEYMRNTTSGYFPITSIHRSDLEDLGYDISGVDDAAMSRLARQMKDAYLEQGFWIDLPILADHLGIPRNS